MSDEIPLGGLADLERVAGSLELEHGEPGAQPGEPDRALLISWIARAVSDYLQYRTSVDPKLRLRYRRAQYWLYNPSRTNGQGAPLGTFEWVCECLGEDPDECRQRIPHMTFSDLPKVDRYSTRRARGHR